MILVSALILFILDIQGECQKPSSQGPPTKEEKSRFLLPQKQSKLTSVEQKGKVLYDYYCVLCHGATGNGDGFNAYMLATPPAKLADPTFIAKLSDEQIKGVIRDGGAAHGLSSLMPSWGGLFKTQDLTTLIAYIRTLSKPDSSSGR